MPRGRGRTEAGGADPGRKHWGIAMTTGRERWLSYGWSVLPSLVAWPGLVVAEDRPALGCGVVAAGLVSAYAFDSWAAGAGQLPRWYLANLRLPLTSIATLSLLATLQHLDAARAEAAEEERP